jgi:hypothetical protein
MEVRFAIVESIVLNIGGFTSPNIISERSFFQQNGLVYLQGSEVSKLVF